LDQLVIQQGKAQQAANKAASRDELLSMIRHGASNIFQSKESTITDDSMESILARSIDKTAKLEEKYKEMGLDDLQKFTSDGTGTVYQWEGEDFSSKKKNAVAWIEPAKRERKSNYSMDDYYREAMKMGPKQANHRAPKPKQTQLCVFLSNFSSSDFQFYPPRILELQEQEILAYQREVEYKIPAVARKVKDETEEDAEAFKKLELIRVEQQERIDTAESLTEAELAEKEELSKHGFGNWFKRDYWVCYRSLMVRRLFVEMKSMGERILSRLRSRLRVKLSKRLLRTLKCFGNELMSFPVCF
jgi:SWI/SNF-related matrix-associated actin-dependent regulator of chromatin subfamily A member 5